LNQPTGSQNEAPEAPFFHLTFRVWLSDGDKTRQSEVTLFVSGTKWSGPAVRFRTA